MVLLSCRRADVLFDLPLPRRIASRPVDWIASTIADGAAVPSTETNWSLRLAVTFSIPTMVNATCLEASTSHRTAKLMQRPLDVFDTCIARHRHREYGFEARNSHF